MKNKSTIAVFVIIVFIIPVMAYALVDWYENKLQQLPFFGQEYDSTGNYTTPTIGNFILTNQAGLKTSTADWKNKIVIVDFFFTHCPAVCPKLTNSLKRVQAYFNPGKDLLFNSFSIDPERDSVSALNQYRKLFALDNHNWHLLTGEKKDIYKLARNSFKIVATDGDGGSEDFIHSEKLVLIDTHKRIRGYYTGTNDAEVSQLIQDIKKLQNEK